MTNNSQPTKDTKDISLSDGDCTAADFCSSCRSLDLKKLIASKSLTKRVFTTSGKFDPRCPFCRFIESIALAPDVLGAHYIVIRNAGPRDIEPPRRIDEWTPRGVLLIAVYGRKSRLTRHRYLLPLAPLERAGAEWPGSFAARNKYFAGPGEYAELPYQHSQATSVDVDFMRKCIKGCQEEHTERCAQPKGEIMLELFSSPGFQMIDCKQKKLVEAPKVLEYVALSYVWGKPQPQEDREADEIQGGLPRHLPKTIEDAIEVTKQLGFRYLWVDKYCINQSAQQGDLQAQLATMDLVYQCAVVTIVAASGEGANSGLAGVGDRPRVQHPSITIDGTTWVTGFRDTRTPVVSSVWATRAWTYQEEHFARRRLIFAENQVLFECNTCRRSESMPMVMSQDEDQSSDIFGSGIIRRRNALQLADHIRLYTERNLTYQSDVLNALQGVFASYSRGDSPVKQLWGIPTSSTGYGIHRRSRFRMSGFEDDDEGDSYDSGSEATHAEKSTHLDESDIHRILAYGLTWVSHPNSAMRRAGFPSWSWGGWVASVRWPIYGAKSFYAAEHPVRFAIFTKDGNSVPLTEEIIDSISLNKCNEAAMYTYNLRIEAEVIQFRIHDLRSLGTEEEILANGDSTSGSKYGAVQLDGSGQLQSFWLLQHTPATGDGDSLHEALCRDVFDCIVLSSLFGIVVRTTAGVAERVGRLELYGREKGDVGKIVGFGDPLFKTDGRHLREVFPGKVREIVLG